MSVETREMKEIEAAVEGILFASGEPVHIDRICLAAELDRPTAELVLQKLMDYYSFERRGMRLLRLEDSWQLCSAPEYADVIRRAFEIRKPAKLSQPALEVLTIIAYYQPTTRAISISTPRRPICTTLTGASISWCALCCAFPLPSTARAST
jgi:segregation and condensation protein B